jgi:hypothetical protein
MYNLGLYARSGLDSAQQIWIIFHVAILFMMLVYVEPPINRALWVFDVHFGLWLTVASIWASVNDPSATFCVSPILFAVLDVILTAEMDTTYTDMSRTAVTIRAIMFTAMASAF